MQVLGQEHAQIVPAGPRLLQAFQIGSSYRDLRAYGVATTDSDYQPTVTDALYKMAVEGIRSLRKEDESRYFDILKPMDGYFEPGEVTVVLGRPGSGCSTLLKTIACNTLRFPYRQRVEDFIRWLHARESPTITVVMWCTLQRDRYAFPSLECGSHLRVCRWIAYSSKQG